MKNLALVIGIVLILVGLAVWHGFKIPGTGTGHILGVSPSGNGVFVVTNCNNITSPVTNGTWCLNATSGTASYWNGTTYVVVGGGAPGGVSGDIQKNNGSTLAASSMNDGGGGVVVGSPTGGAKGAGTINATNVYANGAAVGTGSNIANYTGGVSITGNQTNGTDQISHANLQGVIDPTTYGADPTGSADSAAALQTAINAVASGSVNAPIKMPVGTFKVTRPLVKMTSSPIDFGGSGMTNGSTINATYQGPVMVNIASGVSTGFTVASPIGSNSGHALNFPGGHNAFIDLNQVIPWTQSHSNFGIWGPFDNLASFSVIVFFTSHGPPAVNPIWSSDGNMSCASGGSPNVCTSFGGLYAPQNFGGGPQLTGKLNVGSIASPHLYTLQGGTITTDTCYEAELNLDGTNHNINLYLGPCGGTITRVAQQTGVTGNTVQWISEWNSIGTDRENWPFNSQGFNYVGNIGSIKFMNVARDTGASFTGDTTLTNNANTIALFTWPTALPTNGPSGATLPLLQADSGGWFVIGNGDLGPALGGAWDHDYQITGGTIGIEGIGVTSHSRKLEIGSNMLGEYFQQNATYGSDIEDIDAPNAKEAIAMMMGAIGHASRLQLVSGGAGPSSFNFIGNDIDTDSVYAEGNGYGLCGMYIIGGVHRHWNEDNENGGTFPAVCVGPADNTPAIIENNELEPTGGAGFPPFKIMAGNFAGLVIEGNHISGQSGFTSLVDATSPGIVMNGSISFRNNIISGVSPQIDEPPTGVSWVSGSPALPYCVTSRAGTGCFSIVANLPTCVANNDHQQITVTDANASCSAGTTAVGGGSTKCVEYCNSSGTPAWKETGF